MDKAHEEHKELTVTSCSYKKTEIGGLRAALYLGDLAVVTHVGGPIAGRAISFLTLVGIVDLPSIKRDEPSVAIRILTATQAELTSQLFDGKRGLPANDINRYGDTFIIGR